MGFWNEYRDAVFQVPPLPPPGSLSTPTSGGGGGSTPVVSSSPAAVGTPKVADRSTKEAFIIGLEDNQLQHYYLAGLISDAEMIALKGQAKLELIKREPRTKADLEAAAALAAKPPEILANEFTNYGQAGPNGQMSAGNFDWGEGQGAGFTPSTAAGASQAKAPGTSPTSAGGGASRTAGSSGGGGSTSAAAPPPEPPPAYNSATDLSNRGAIPSGRSGVALLNGQQYRNPGSPIKGEDNLWYNVGPDGQPSGAGFKSETAANYAKAYVDYGPGMTSRLGNSPTAKGAMQGGYSQQVENPLFNTFSMDQSIAAGAQKGIQGGDILGTMNRAGYQPLDITYGGISEQGGLTPIGNPADPFSSFAGQIAGNTSIGMSSILGNSGHDTLHWLSQMSGAPPSEIAKLKIDTPEKAIQFQQAVDTARQMGTMPNFASLYALNEPAAPGGAYGGSDLKWGSANGGANNTEYDRQLAGFMNYALGSPDLAYLPEPSGMGSTQVGNVAYGSNMLIDPNYYYGG